MIILGISCFYHDSSACILKDDEIIAAAAEERFTRRKHDNRFPRNAIDFCLKYLGIAANEIDVVAFYEKPIIKFERILSQHLQHFPKSGKTFIESMGSWMNERLQIKKNFFRKSFTIKERFSIYRTTYPTPPAPFTCQTSKRLQL